MENLENTLSVQKPLNGFTNLLKRKVTEYTGESSQFIDIVIRGYNNKIKDIADDKRSQAVMMVLERNAKKYGARAEIPMSVYEECVILVMEKFSHLGASEIQEAYRQWATDENRDRSSEMYGGEFNANQLGRVLTVYNARRKNVLATFLKEKQKADMQSRDRVVNQKKQEKFDREFPKMIEQAKENCKSWRDVPAYFYEAAKSRGMIAFKNGEAEQIFEEAKTLASSEIEIELKEENSMVDRRLILRQIEERKITRAQVIARKITVFRKLLT